ncbi:MAG: T9SS type A sorting domain-containing protein [Saprospiraceae bacterium]
MKNFFILFIITNVVQINAQQIWKPTSSIKGSQEILFAAHNSNEIIASVPNRGMYLTDDGGINWTKISKGLYRINSSASNIVSSNDGYFYAIIDDELYRLRKGELEWDKTIFKYKNGVDLLVGLQGNLYALSYEYNARPSYSTDHGETMKATELPSIGNSVSFFTVSGNDNNYFIREINNDGTYIYKFNDDGSNIHQIKKIDYNVQLMYFHPAGYLFFYDSSIGLFRMDSNGNDYQVLSGFPRYAYVNRMITDRNNNIVVITQTGDYISKDYGETWAKLKTNYYKLSDPTYNSSFLYEGDTALYSPFNCNQNDFMRTEDGGKSWKSLGSNWDNLSIDDLQVSDIGNIVGTTCNEKKYFSSTDKGLSWNLVYENKNNSPVTNLVVTKSNKWLTMLNNILYSSIDNGQTWISNNYNFQSNSRLKNFKSEILAVIDYSISQFSIDEGLNWNKIDQQNYVIGSLFRYKDGTIFGFSSSGLLYSENLGTTWEKLSINISPDYIFIDKLGQFYISSFGNSGAENGIFFSKDKFENITHISDESIKIYSEDKNGNLYGIDYDNRIKKSTDHGLTWKRFETGLPYKSESNSMAIDKDDYLYTGLRLDNIYRTFNPVSESSNVSNSSIQKDISINCNPCSDNISIIGLDQTEDNFMFQLFYSDGKIALQSSCNNILNQVHVNQLSNGIYFWQLRSDTDLISRGKVIIQH